MSEIEFTPAVIKNHGKENSVLLSDVVQIRDETEGGSIQWRLEFGISRANPDEMEWEELDDLVQGRSELKFRIDGLHELPVDAWFGETGSRIGIRLPDISLGIDLAWHNLEGPVETVEALWVDSEGRQELGSLLVRSLDYVPPQAWHDPSQQKHPSGSGCASTFLFVACLASGIPSMMT